MRHFKAILKVWDYNSQKQICKKWMCTCLYVYRYIHNLQVPTTTLLIITTENYYYKKLLLSDI